jgi:hypothetical protein
MLRLCVECVVAAERSGLLQALEKIVADRMFVHFKERGKIFPVDRMVKEFESIFVGIAQLV